MVTADGHFNFSLLFARIKVVTLHVNDYGIKECHRFAKFAKSESTKTHKNKEIQIYENYVFSMGIHRTFQSIYLTSQLNKDLT